MPRTEGGEGVFPEALAMARMVGGAAFFQTVVFCLRLKKSASPAKPIGLANHGKLAGLAVLGIALNQALFLVGLRASTPFVVSVLGATIPVLTAALAVVFGKERPSVRMGLGLALAFSGVLWLTGVASAGGAGFDRGALLVALNCLSFAAYVVFSRDVVLALGSLRFMAWVFTYGALLFAAFGLRPLLATLPALTLRGALLLGYMIVFPTIVAYLLNAWALARSSASTMTIYIYMQPLIAALLARVQLGHGISPRAGLSAVLILGGVAVTTLKRR